MNESKYPVGFTYYIGCDEVGRGCLIGPVVGAAVYLGTNVISGLKDSKKLTATRRENLSKIIKQNSISHIVEISADEIDRINILQASLLAMSKSVLSVINQLEQKYDISVNDKICVLIDGNKCLNIRSDFNISEFPIVKGDSIFAEISAASIIAKHYRDSIMYDWSKLEKYHGYLLEKHKGYPTAAHMQALHRYGITDDYRKSYSPIRKLLDR